MKVETVPCMYDIRRDCPQTCRLRNESYAQFRAIVEKRKETSKIISTPEEILNQLRKEAQINHGLFSGRHVLVFRGEPKTLECEQRSGILSGISPF